uniref:ATP-dependent Clp protease adaptor ClpS n=1 Tax=Gelidibacter sp. TaxID=2018083 RepID=UPI00404911B3
MNLEHILLSLETLLEGHLGNPKEKTSVDVLLDEEVSKNNEIVLYNDDVNTFDHVIDTLIYACDHTPEQAEQCSIIVHYKGKCTVKTGSYDDLEPRCSMLLDAGLSAEII